jgi:hypothetical protein
MADLLAAGRQGGDGASSEEWCVVVAIMRRDRAKVEGLKHVSGSTITIR